MKTLSFNGCAVMPGTQPYELLTQLMRSGVKSGGAAIATHDAQLTQTFIAQCGLPKDFKHYRWSIGKGYEYPVK